MNQTDKNRVEVRRWILKDGNMFEFYGAEWCPSCRKIKPNILEHMKKLNADYKEDMYMPKPDFKKINDLIPFFRILKKGEEFKEELDKIQTSDFETFLKWFNKHIKIEIIDFDDDF